MTKTQANTNEVTPIMPALELKGLVDRAIAADKAHGNAYTAIFQDLIKGIASGLINAASAKEYERRAHAFSKGLATSRGVEPESVRKALRRYAVAANWVAPKEPRSEDDIAKAKRTKEANERALRREKQALRKANPKVEFDDKELAELAKAQLAEKKQAQSEAGKQEKARNADILTLNKMREAYHAQTRGDGNPHEIEMAFAALVIMIHEFN